MKHKVTFQYYFNDDKEIKTFEEEFFATTPKDAFNQALEKVLLEKYVGKSLEGKTLQEMLNFMQTVKDSLRVDKIEVEDKTPEFKVEPITKQYEPDNTFQDFLSSRKENRVKKGPWMKKGKKGKG